ncbi:MAG: cytochrome C oxidase subunit IV family protein [Simkania sp.]|jgi:cytochrome o ubiquinol oxidase operon protein cyoD|uniref:Cytochrome bo(3) ubiquinol oxidase subunit 4 n=1 Tax=Simkania negevensis (strain ATCC VR-1471 / DSM 27360 / Z) TaxID=331113 RepID=F8L9H0_SIMNZ|nr:cytochrome C oxidase subunit IV family protein [Simkania negevensis]MCB1067098.1 cytochrome C oxidase subunit IV family protein [Simkania sp.]MCP5490577.1 cytochrome C oxidase subunit IV family protein [Chlamydiales bacterium]MCB1075857.1 cytochrome C oxidase subunit IV family protein [Simkania sp.]MCB1083882.1 cytochrome C oxidase subunit IV family protein [Simkania sp.]CCB89507.1 cytochrome o ubiquinol oxidase protein CyoD [Simkania negevensis Z]
MIDTHHGWNFSFKPITIGFVLSIILTAAAYRIVTHHHVSKMMMTEAVAFLAIAQAALQLIFFLHLGLESKPRWSSFMFLSMVFFILVLVIGSIWIMWHLGYNTMPSMEQMKQM